MNVLRVCDRLADRKAHEEQKQRKSVSTWSVYTMGWNKK